MTGRNIANPLAGVIASAAKRLPKATGAVAPYAERLSGAGTATVIIADVSGSMADRVGAKRKADILQEAIDYTLPALTAPVLIAFSSLPQELGAADRLPEPSGGTALHLALAHAARHRPRHSIVISDGQPDDGQAALAAADRLGGIIDVIYCGPDGDETALAFMRELARRGRGRLIVRDLKRAAPAALRHDLRQLALPAPPDRGQGQAGATR